MFLKLKDYYLNAKRPKKVEYILCGLALLCSYLFLCQLGDLQITILHSYDLLSITKNGNFFHFYTIVMNKALAGGYYGNPGNIVYAANYNILLYLVLAICLIPCKLFQVITNNVPSLLFMDMYVRFLLLVVLFFSAYVLKKLVLKLHFTKDASLWAMVIFLGSPIILFGSVAFGQFDIITVLLILISLLFYYEKKFIKFSLIIAVALCFKYFAILMFIPLLLFAEKRIWKIVEYVAIALSGVIFTKLLASFDSGYQVTQKQLSDIYKFHDSVFSSSWVFAFSGISLFIFSFIIVCIISYYIKPTEKNYLHYSILLPLVSYCCFFSLVSWHPQWVVLVVPFFTLSLLFSNDVKTMLLMDIGIGIFFILTSVYFFEKNVDNYMVNGAILPAITGKHYAGITAKAILMKFPLDEKTYFTGFVAFFVSWIVIFVLDQKTKNNKEIFNPERALIWSRFIVTIGFVLISTFLYFR